VRRARDVLVGNEPKSGIVELVAQHKGLDDAITQLDNCAAAQKAMNKESPVHTTKIKWFWSALRDANTKPIVRTSRMTKFVINNKEIRLVHPDPTGVMLLVPG
jgi:hypothetical protein